MSRLPEGHRRWVRSYYPGLDGLRGVAILLVFLRHYGVLVVPTKLFYAGWVGVDLFFVLSGFLITGILYDSKAVPSFYPNFYIRRALRILPLIYLLFAIAGILRHLHVIFFHLDLWSYALFFGNLLVYTVDLNKHNPTIIQFSIHHHLFKLSIGYLWSLCVEEQFYLFWPVVVTHVSDRKHLMRLCVVVIVFALLLRTVVFFFAPSQMTANLAIHELLFTRIDTLLVGAWLALWLRGRLLTRSQLRGLGFGVGGGCLAGLLLGVWATIGRWPTVSSNPFLSTVGYTLIAAAGGSLLLLTLDDELLLTRWLVNPWITGLGTVSYGFYILHNLPLPVVTHFVSELTLGKRAAVIFALFVVTAVASFGSFVLFESRFLRLKAVLAPRGGRVPRVPQQPGI